MFSLTRASPRHNQLTFHAITEARLNGKFRDKSGRDHDQPDMSAMLAVQYLGKATLSHLKYLYTGSFSKDAFSQGDVK